MNICEHSLHVIVHVSESKEGATFEPGDLVSHMMNPEAFGIIIESDDPYVAVLWSVTPDSVIFNPEYFKPRGITFRGSRH